jgi:hypothetical protein
LWTSSKKAAALKTLPGCGPYLAKIVINMMLRRGLGPGAISSLEFLNALTVANLPSCRPAVCGLMHLTPLACVGACVAKTKLPPFWAVLVAKQTASPHIHDAKLRVLQPDPVSLAHTVVDYLQKSISECIATVPAVAIVAAAACATLNDITCMPVRVQNVRIHCHDNPYPGNCCCGSLMTCNMAPHIALAVNSLLPCRRRSHEFN